MNDEVQALHEGAGVMRRDDLYTLQIAGPDRERYLNGMVTSDVSKLEVGRAQRAIKPNNRGRVEGLLRIRAEDDTYLVDVVEASAQRVATQLQQFIIMDDCTLVDKTAEREVVAVYGPNARQALIDAGFLVPVLEDLQFVRLDDALILRDDDVAGIEGYEVHVGLRKGDDVVKVLIVAGALEVSDEAVDVLRVETGTPRDGVDVNVDTIPLEANLIDWISFTKGCYVGQEVIARAHNLGGVKHRLVGLFIEGDEPPPHDAKLSVGDRVTGTLTTVVSSPTFDRVLGLGYVHIKHEAPGTSVRVTWDGGETTATVAALPFTRP